ncbi:MAG: polysaccharide biosynthesis tyrosine autokinase [Nostocaceae cyanobacterium]|nr:polysaccharide biosynthesis tyrosine autokinase [Nostocaceae cyanobacterium]
MIESNLNHLNPAGETDPGYGQLFAVLIRRKFWFLSVFVSAIAIAAVVTQKTPPSYQSSMQLLIEQYYQAKQDTTGTEHKFADSNVVVDTATQLNLMRSTQLIQQTVNLLRPEYPDITVDEIKENLVLSQIKDEDAGVNTKIFLAEYKANDAKKTQRILEAMQRVYLDYNRRQQQLRLDKGLEFINKKLPEVRESVRQAERALEKFRKTQNLIEPQAQANALVESLSNIERERVATRSQYNDAQARFVALQQQINSSPKKALVGSRLSESTRYQTLLNEVQKTELAIATLRLKFTDQSPNVQQLLQQRQSQLALLQQEVGRALGGQSAQVQASGENLLEQGQLGQIDRQLASQMVEAQTTQVALQARDQSLAEREQQLRAELKRFPSLLAEYNRLQPEVELKRQTLQDLLKAQQQLSLEISRGGFDWQVVEQPKLGEKIGPNLRQNLLLGAVVGLVLGGIAAFLREAMDDSVHTTAELEKQVALPLLGTAPKLLPNKASEPVFRLPFGKPEILTPWKIQVLNWPPCWEAVDLIYKNIELLNSVSTLKSLMLTSALAGEGKSTLALGLALSAARLHKRVLLIDADLRNPSLHKKLHLPNNEGLSTLLANEVPLPREISIQSSGASYIDILTAGPTPADPANLLSSPRMGDLMSVFEQSYDLVIVDAPPVIGMVDAVLTASFCQGVVLVARMGGVTRSEVTQACTMLSKLNVIGVVANGALSSSKNYLSYVKKQHKALQQAAEI